MVERMQGMAAEEATPDGIDVAYGLLRQGFAMHVPGVDAPPEKW